MEKSPFSKERFSFWKKNKMRNEIERRFSDKSATKEYFEDNVRDEMFLLAYYTASTLLPSSLGFGYDSADKVHNTISQKIFDSVFNSDNPDFDPKENRAIISLALSVAVSEWENVYYDRQKSPYERLYASLVAAEMKERIIKTQENRSS